MACPKKGIRTYGSARIGVVCVWQMLVSISFRTCIRIHFHCPVATPLARGCLEAPAHENVFMLLLAQLHLWLQRGQRETKKGLEAVPCQAPLRSWRDHERIKEGARMPCSYHSIMANRDALHLEVLLRSRRQSQSDSRNRANPV